MTPIMWSGPLEGWVAALERPLELGAARFVPGHGPVCGVDEVRRLIDYRRWLDQPAGRLLEAGSSPTEAARELVLGDEIVEEGFAGWLGAEAAIGWFTRELWRWFDEFASTPEGFIDGGRQIVVPVHVQARANHVQLRPEAPGTDGGGGLVEQRDELGRGSPANRPGRVGSNCSAGAASMSRAPATRARTSSSGSEPFHPAQVSTRIRVATSPGWWWWSSCATVPPQERPATCPGPSSSASISAARQSA